MQGLGGAIVLPLTLTILSSAVPADKRGLALGAWGGISGLAVAFGPLVGGAVVSGMSFGMFGSVFLPAQFFQTVQHYTPLGSGLRILPWTAMPMLVAPVAGALSDRIGGHRLIGAGLALQAAGLAWIAALQTPTVAYADLIAPFTLSGIGMGLFFAPVANVVLSAVRPDQEGQASGANNAIRELGGVLGVAVLASVFAHYGGYRTGQTSTDGMIPAVYLGAAIVALGSLAALAIGRRRPGAVAAEPALELSA